MTGQRAAFALALLLGAAWVPAQTTLGTWMFNDNMFGDLLVESDGGSQSGNNWLNTVNSNPGNPGFLTGANFDTGIANIPSSVSYTIVYNTPIPNILGDDLGVVVARFSADDFNIEVSTNGTDFTAPVLVSSGSGLSTGEARSYFYGGGGPYSGSLFVHPLDLTDLGLSLGEEAVAIRITSATTQLDLVRVAGLVPEPASLVALALGAGLLVRRRLRK